MATVSVIIIFLNGEKFISEAIESVLAQTYQDWELLLVDDGSTDKSTAIALDYARHYSDKVFYLEHPDHENRGMSASRNRGIERAEGSYITFLDADDVWLPHKLEQQVTFLETYPKAAMVYGKMLLWYSWAGNTSSGQKDYCAPLGIPANTVVHPPKLLINSLTQHYQTPGTSNVMIRSSVFKQFGCFEEQFRGWGEDRTFFAKLQLNVPIFVSDQIWVKYRQHSNSCCHLTAQDKAFGFEIYETLFNWLEVYLQEQLTDNPEVWRALESAKRKLKQRRSFLYSFWSTCLELSLALGRSILPESLRHWLWVHIGIRLYSFIG